MWLQTRVYKSLEELHKNAVNQQNQQCTRSQFSSVSVQKIMISCQTRHDCFVLSVSVGFQLLAKAVVLYLLDVLKLPGCQ